MFLASRMSWLMLSPDLLLSLTLSLYLPPFPQLLLWCLRVRLQCPPPILSDPVLSSYDFRCFSALQLSCPSVSKRKSSLSLGLVCVPLELHQELFELLHRSSHPGIRASWRLAWIVQRHGSLGSCLSPLSVEEDSDAVHACIPAIPVPSRPFFHVHLNLVGPLPFSHGFTYLLTMIDRTSSWRDVDLLNSITVESCVRVFFFTWVVQFGVPSVLTL